jgi:hypothetical protein
MAPAGLDRGLACQASSQVGRGPPWPRQAWTEGSPSRRAARWCVAPMPRQAWTEGSPSRRAANRQCRPVVQGIVLVSPPRSPGRKPGDSGCENQPAVYAAWRHVTSRLKPTSHGTREGLRPGVPRLPPGASWIVLACQSGSKTGERLPSSAATRDAAVADRSTLPRKPHHDR